MDKYLSNDFKCGDINSSKRRIYIVPFQDLINLEPLVISEKLT